jgi:hypothetical protein
MVIEMVFETFKYAEIAVPGRDGDNLFQFLPKEGVYMVGGAFLVEIQEIAGGDGQSKRVIIISMLDSEKPTKAYIINEPNFEEILYFDTLNLKIYIGFKRDKSKVYGETDLLIETVEINKKGIEAQQFDMKFIHKSDSRLKITGGK